MPKGTPIRYIQTNTIFIGYRLLCTFSYIYYYLQHKPSNLFHFNSIQVESVPLKDHKTLNYYYLRKSSLEMFNPLVLSEVILTFHVEQSKQILEEFL